MSERRKFKRLSAALDLSCREVGCPTEQFHKGRTINVSPGGLYFETPAEMFKSGSLLKVELSIPPKSGELEFGGRISAYAKVLRASSICDSVTDADFHSSKYGIALEFCRSPKLSG